MTDMELIKGIQKLDAEIESIKTHIECHNKALEAVEEKRQILVNALMLRMADREKPKKIFCCFRRSKG